jgi:hypothetical protein
MDADDPRNWRLEVDQDRIDLYLDLLEHPRELSEVEPRMMVKLVDAWRALEHRKHIALKAELSRREAR